MTTLGETLSDTPVAMSVARTRAPNASDDNTQGYAIGLYWVDTAATKVYVCTSHSTGAAAWKELTNVTAPPVPPFGNITYRHLYTAALGQASPPDHGWDWGMQYASNPVSNFAIIPDGIATGIPSGRITVSPTGTAIEGLKKHPLVIGQRQFWGLMLKFPTTWQEPSGAGWGAAIAQVGYQALANHTWGLFAHADHVQFILLSGKHTWPNVNQPGIGNPIREYDNSTQLGTWPNGPRAIPSSRFVKGVWHELIFDILWSTVRTSSADFAQVGVPGHTRIYHRIMGGAGALGQWTLTVESLDIPTLQWGYGYDFGSGNPPYMSVLGKSLAGAQYTASDKFGLYAANATFNRVLEHGKILTGTGFDIVASEMPT